MVDTATTFTSTTLPAGLKLNATTGEIYWAQGPSGALPEALRRQLPALTLGGAVYAELPAQRVAIVNGQVFHEGDRPVAELRVEQIRPRSVVFSWQGQRFEMAL